MKSIASALWTAFLFQAFSINSQSLTQTLDPASCVENSPVTAFPNCNYVEDTINKCASPSVSAGASFISCFCNQALFNGFVGCGNEQRLCLGNDDEDAQVQSEIDLWHSACDNVISFSVTTPPLSTITASYNQDVCGSIVNDCASVSFVNQGCYNSFTGAKYLSCDCQPSVILEMYTCEVIGNRSCRQAPGAVTNMPAYKFCSNGPSILAGIEASSLNNTPASSPASTTSSSESSTTSIFSPTKPSLPGSTSTSLSTASTTSQSEALALLPGYILGLACSGIIVMCSILSF